MSRAILSISCERASSVRLSSIDGTNEGARFSCARLDSGLPPRIDWPGASWELRITLQLSAERRPRLETQSRGLGDMHTTQGFIRRRVPCGRATSVYRPAVPGADRLGVTPRSRRVASTRGSRTGRSEAARRAARLGRGLQNLVQVAILLPTGGQVLASRRGAILRLVGRRNRRQPVGPLV